MPNEQIRAELLRRFPWLQTDEEANGGDTVQALADWFASLEPVEADPRDAVYREYARENIHDECVLEVDDNAKVSICDNEEAESEPENGAYVQCWHWIYREDVGHV